MRVHASSILVGGLVLAAVAGGCIAEPRFEQSDHDAATDELSEAGATGTDGVDDEMVLVPTTVIATPGDSSAAAGNHGGHDDDKPSPKPKDGGAPPPPPPPAPSTSHTVVPAFWLDAREVAASAYAACVAAGRCTAAGNEEGCTVAAGLDRHPANCIDVDQARAFCAWRNKRLVTNDEWTAAAAGAVGRPYPWGDAAPTADRLNACGTECGSPSMYAGSDGYPRTAPRGSFPLGRTPDGAYDLAGNVAEWIDLAGASVARGGSFADVDRAAVSALSLRATTRSSPTIGFRCARDR